MDEREDRGGGMYRTRRLEDKRSSYGAVIAIVAAFAVTGWAWFLFRSGYLDIQTIDPGPLQSLDRGEVVAETERALSESGWRPWSEKNLLMLNTTELAIKLKDRLFADNVAVEKSYPNVLRLKIGERQRSVVVESNSQYVLVDAKGIVTAMADGDVLRASQDRVAAKAFADEIHLPVVVMNTADPLAPGFQVASPEEIRRWLDATRYLVLGGLQFRFMKVESPQSALGRFVSKKGYDIYFDLTQPLEPQLMTYTAYLKTKPDESRITEYLDARVPGKVFIK
ncbi:MAG: hypothetical protein ABIO72_01250 [Patescibacteria group bacterium]